MTIFWILAFIMTAAVLGLLTPALLGRRRAQSADRDSQNVHIARERLRELQTELQQGRMTAAQFEAARSELEQVLLDDVSADTKATGGTVARVSQRTLALLLLLVPALAGSLYYFLGQPAAITVANASATRTMPTGHPAVDSTDRLPSIEEMAARLQQRLEQQPDDAQGWVMLGRTHMALRHYSEAAAALEKAYRLSGKVPAVILTYADALAMSNGGRVDGKPFELVLEALAIAPENPTALWLAGLGYEEQGDHVTAVRHWKKLEPLLAGDDQSRAKVRQLIAGAEQQLGSKAGTVEDMSGGATTTPPATAVELTISVSLDPGLSGRARPTDTVFVFARALQGPPMPLAVVRKQVKDLPFEVTLTDAMAMMPDMKLSGFGEVRVGARISSSGNAMPQSGDLQGEVSAVSVASSAPVEVVINSRRP